MHPIKDWTVQRGFTFGQPYPPSFGPLAGQPHLGLDFIVPVGTQIRAPFDGSIGQFNGTEGGLTLYFYPDWTDLIMRFMHLSQITAPIGRVSAGEPIALSGDTGTESSVPNIHLDISPTPLILNFSRFQDPEKYPWATTIPVTLYGQFPTMFPDALNAQVAKWSLGDIQCDFTIINAPIAYPVSMDQAYALRITNAPESMFFIIVCNPQPAIFKTFGTASGDAFLTIGGNDSLTLSYEFSHALQGWYNAHRGPYPYLQVPDTVGTITDTQRYYNYESIKPYLGYVLGSPTQQSMTQNEVAALYTLLSISDPDGSGKAFWLGKNIMDFLTTYAKNRITELQNIPTSQ